VCEASDAIRTSASRLAVDGADWRGVLEARRLPRRADTAERVVLLGTAGGGNPKSTRAGYANAVVVDDAAYLVDCGEGAHTQLWRAGLAVNPGFAGGRRPRVATVFVTHLHADHIMDLANLFMGSWPSHVIDLYGPGPDGLRVTMNGLMAAFAYNVKVRMADEGRSNVADAYRVHEIGVTSAAAGAPEIDLHVAGDGSSTAAAAPPMEPIVIQPEDDHGVKVSAVLVQHAPVFPALGYRFDTPHGAVAFSGDTGACENVVRLARGADVLVHEVIDVDRLLARLRRLPNYEAVRAHLGRSHSSPEEAGTIAAKAGVGTVVLSHLVPGDGEVTEDEWEARVRSTFDGDVVCGVDLDEFALV
jgi:ribonuclease BN (tRNA processing enzyme)